MKTIIVLPSTCTNLSKRTVQRLEIQKTAAMNLFSYQVKNQKQEEERRGDHKVETKGIPYLPSDLIIEILSRLPVKVLCKFRCVSKPWHDLLTWDREFMTRHMEWSKQRLFLLMRRYLPDGIDKPNKQQTITIELTSIDMEGNVSDKFRKVIDGPVHTFISYGSLSVLCCMYTLYVCNPSTHQIAHVPNRSNVQLYSIGFGYHPKTNEYKIVHLFHHLSVRSGKMGCEIFTFKNCEGVTSGSWKTIGDCPFNAWTDEYPVCVNGMIYWALSSGWKEKSILLLDLGKEEFKLISYPEHDSKKYTFLEYIGLMGTLCEVGFTTETSTLDIRMLKNDKNNIWVLEHSISFFPLCPKFLISFDDQSDEILFSTEQRDLISYSLKSQTSKKIGYCTMKNYHKHCVYYGSLVPLHSQ